MNLKQKHNPENIQVGDIVLADKDVHEDFKVKVLKITKNGMFCLVELGESQWTIMTYRLSKTKE